MQTTTEELTLLRAIADTPDQAAPRTAYAACLERRGEFDRARFIRGQLEAAGLPEGDDRRIELELESQDLLYRSAQGGRPRNRELWEAPYRQLGVQLVEWERGCPARVAVSSTAFLRHGVALTDLGVYHVNLQPTQSEREDVLDAVIQSPGFARLRGMDAWRFRPTPPTLHRLASCPHLRHLDLSWNDLGPDHADALTVCPALTHLALTGNTLGRRGAEILGQSGMTTLLFLSLSHNGIGSNGLRALAEGPMLRTVISLNLSGNAIGPNGVRSLAATPPSKLRHLDLSGNPIGTEGVQALTNANILKELVTLNLRDARIGIKGVAALAEAESLPPEARLILDEFEGTGSDLKRWWNRISAQVSQDVHSGRGRW